MPVPDFNVSLMLGADAKCYGSYLTLNDMYAPQYRRQSGIIRAAPMLDEINARGRVPMMPICRQDDGQRDQAMRAPVLAKGLR
jgi:hypothetical protein